MVGCLFLLVARLGLLLLLRTLLVVGHQIFIVFLLINGKLIFVLFLALLRKIGPKSTDDGGYFYLRGLWMVFLHDLCLGFGESQIWWYWHFWLGNRDVMSSFFCLDVFFLFLSIRLFCLLIIFFLWLYGLRCSLLLFFLFPKLHPFLKLVELFLLRFGLFDSICF